MFKSFLYLTFLLYLFFLYGCKIAVSCSSMPHHLDTAVDQNVEDDQGEEGADRQGDHREHSRHLYNKQICTN